ncbi:hypothetical protein FJM67_16565 [Maribrevibacterium harenarium]|uniref:Uncharacterized protein n=1 Tax=Maribrevibacterium harenarium TaxID=2589817 RepID=A0A501WDZ8_9GAMM|nr:hypothetical protein [Maribrevibacterium harenarium]TPE45117.1 hypothetical protein FJM67_16565 [Maribrevibacterium harenarium]
MRIEQAVYGEVSGRGHGLRTSSMKNSELAKSLASHLDLPDSIPLGISNWSPFVRGFPIDDQYVIARTFLDPSASRSGMVLTHALIIRIEEIAHIEDFAFLFECLFSSADEFPDNLSPLMLVPSLCKSSPDTELIAAANALSDPAGRTAIWLGVTGFEELVCSLWKNLWPDLRRTFSFRLSFSPKDIVDDPKPSIVCSPEKLQSLWINQNLINQNSALPMSEIARILCGHADVTPILKLANSLEIKLDSLTMLARLERLNALLSDNFDVDCLLGALRLTEGLSKNPELGKKLKTSLISKISALISKATLKQLLVMRNLTLVGFNDTKEMWNAVENRVCNLDFGEVNDDDLSSLFIYSVNPDLAIYDWRESIQAALKTVAHKKPSSLFRGIWRCVPLANDAFSAAISILPKTDDIESELVLAIPNKLSPPKTSALLTPLLKKQWIVAHGAVLGSVLSPLEAVEQQIQIDTDSSKDSGIRAALRFATPAQVLAYAVKFKDSRLIEWASELAVNHPEILHDILCKDIIEQQVWRLSIEKKPTRWNSPSDPINARDTLLVMLENGSPIDNRLLEVLANTPLANLYEAPDRENLWKLLPARTCDRYLQATVFGWVESAEQSTSEEQLEAELEQAIVSSTALAQALAKPTISITTRVSMISSLPSFKEENFISWAGDLLNTVRPIQHSEAEQLGRLMFSRRWKAAVRHLASHHAPYRTDLKPCLTICNEFLDWYTAWRLGISKPSASDKWSALERLVCDLYPNGPDTDELWSRAGGNNWDLLNQSQSGLTRWHSALNKIRSGGSLKSKKLMETMLDDFPENEELKFFSNDSDILGISRSKLPW